MEWYRIIDLFIQWYRFNDKFSLVVMFDQYNSQLITITYHVMIKEMIQQVRHLVIY